MNNQTLCLLFLFNRFASLVIIFVGSQLLIVVTHIKVVKTETQGYFRAKIPKSILLTLTGKSGDQKNVLMALWLINDYQSKTENHRFTHFQISNKHTRTRRKKDIHKYARMKCELVVRSVRTHGDTQTR